MIQEKESERKNLGNDENVHLSNLVKVITIGRMQGGKTGIIRLV